MMVNNEMFLNKLQTCWNEYRIEHNIIGYHYFYGLANIEFINFMLNHYGIAIVSQYYINDVGHLSVRQNNTLIFKVTDPYKKLLFDMKYLDGSE